MRGAATCPALLLVGCTAAEAPTAVLLVSRFESGLPAKRRGEIRRAIALGPAWRREVEPLCRELETLPESDS